MLRMYFFAAMALCATFGGVTFWASAPASAADEQSKAPAAQEARSCISFRSVKQIYVINDYVVVYELNGKRFYRTTFSRSCNGLGRYRAFTTELRNPERLCEGDDLIVSLTQSICRLQDFQPISDDDLLRLQYAAYLQSQKKDQESKDRSKSKD